MTLALTSISKAFPGVQALAEVSLEVQAGEVHALMGENGAGKSTLMKIASGWYQPDAGSITLDGQPLTLRTPSAAQGHGIITVYQELSVLPNLDVARNVLIGRLPARSSLWVDRKAAVAEAGRILDDLGIDLDPATPIDHLSVGQQQMVEIARAVSHRPRFLILDEPTSSLGRHEEEQLMGIVRKLREDGVGIVYISHRMNEVFALADRITVLRDGALVATRPAAEFTRDTLISAMVGREVESRSYAAEVAHQEPVMSVRGLSYGSRVSDASLDLFAGEVLGVAGLMGSGRTELALMLAGIASPDSGTMSLDGRPYAPASVRRAMSAGVSYVSEDRKNEGLLLGMSVADNINLPTLWRNSLLGLLRGGQLRAQAGSWIERLGVKTPSRDTAVGLLSGGNQQKVALAKWLSTSPRVVLLDEPTRGVDVGAKAEIHQLIRSLAAEGAAVMVISSDLPEILSVSDRIAVMARGRTVGELSAVGATEEAVMQLAFEGADA